jgi:hypothetical protein
MTRRNSHKLEMTVGSVKQAEDKLEELFSLVTNLRLDAYGDLRMLRDSHEDFEEEELDRVRQLYNRLRFAAEGTLEQLSAIVSDCDG